MARRVWWVGLTLLLAGCPPRVGTYSPRLEPTPEHRDAVAAKNCRDCHEPARIPHHKATDDCTRCHVLCRGC